MALASDAISGKRNNQPVASLGALWHVTVTSMKPTAKSANPSPQASKGALTLANKQLAEAERLTKVRKEQLKELRKAYKEAKKEAKAARKQVKSLKRDLDLDAKKAGKNADRPRKGKADGKSSRRGRSRSASGGSKAKARPAATAAETS